MTWAKVMNERLRKPDAIDDTDPDNIYLGYIDNYRFGAEVDINERPVYRITKLVNSGFSGRQTLWANGTDSFDKVWKDRATYTYSHLYLSL